VVQPEVSFCLFAAANSANFNVLQRSFLVAGGPVEMLFAGHTVIQCDGDLEARQILDGCVVVASGSVCCPRHTQNCLILAGGEVRVPDYHDVRDCIIRSSSSLVVAKKGRLGRNDIKERDKNALAPVRFFQPAHVGIEVAAAEGAVRLKRLDVDKAFARAGLRAGDLILQVDGTAVGTPEGFRKTLRRRVASGGEGVFKLRRAGKTFDVQVPCGG
jgi:hypothetical protein